MIKTPSKKRPLKEQIEKRFLDYLPRPVVGLCAVIWFIGYTLQMLGFNFSEPGNIIARAYAHGYKMEIEQKFQGSPEELTAVLQELSRQLEAIEERLSHVEGLAHEPGP